MTQETKQTDIVVNAARGLWEKKSQAISGGSVYTNGTLSQGTITGTTFQIKPTWNVVEEGEFRKKTHHVFSQVAQTLERTLGPYGSTTILEGFSDAHITKDGWQVLKRIRFVDRIEQTVHKMLLNISSQVVIKVGDGSTSSIVAANEVYKTLNESALLKELRSKDLLDSLRSIAERITNHILENNATPINRDGDFEEIYRLALISTNGEQEIASFIQEIYKQTGNPSIEYRESKVSESTYEVINGYKAEMGYIDEIFKMNDRGECIVEHPVVLMFDHTIDRASLVQIIQPITATALSENRRVVVIAPHIDSMLKEHISNQVNACVRSNALPPVVYVAARLNDIRQKVLYGDFSSLMGTRIITQVDMYNLAHQNGQGEDMEEALESVNVTDFIGSVDKMVITREHTIASGFDGHRDELRYQTMVNDAKQAYNELQARHSKLSMVDPKLFEAKKRVAKLSCKMGSILVGGRSEMAKRALLDLVEDAVKASESAFNYGYNTGGNLVIPIAVAELIATDDTLTASEKEILSALGGAFVNVYEKVLSRRYGVDSPKLNEISMESIERRECYNLLKEEYDGTVINPTHTDVEILNAVVSIISLLLSSNQYIALDAEQH